MDFNFTQGMLHDVTDAEIESVDEVGTSANQTIENWRPNRRVYVYSLS